MFQKTPVIAIEEHYWDPVLEAYFPPGGGRDDNLLKRLHDLGELRLREMDESGIDIKAHKPMTFEELDDLEGLNFDLIVTLSPEAHHRALELTRTSAVDVEYWPTADPTAIEGSREQRMNAYREVRDQLLQRIRTRFFPHQSGNE